MDRTTQRCNKCLMTASFPGICFDEEGICNECRNFKRIEPLGEGRLLEVLNSRKGDKYDCIIGISGGRDSSYVAYLAKEKFKLRGLAVFYDSPFYCDLARENVRTVCSNLNLDLKIVNSKDNLEYKLLQNHFLSVGATGTSWGQCIFCHYGIEAVIYNLANKLNIPFSLSGVTKYEKWDAGNKTQILLSRVKKLPVNDLMRFAYYQSKAYLLLRDQRKQFNMPCSSMLNVYNDPEKPQNGPLSIKVFDYIQWDPNLIEKTLIEKTGWIKPENGLSWGYDCSLEPFLDYTYKKEFGISTVGLYFSHLIRDGLIDRDEAMKTLEKSEDDNMLKEKLEKVFDFLEIPQSIRTKFYTTQ